MASLIGLGPHQTFKELLRIDNDPTRNVGVTGTLQRVADGAGAATSLSVSSSAAKVWGTLDVTNTSNLATIISTGNISGLTLTGTSLSIGPSGGSAVGGISSTGAVTGISLNIGTGAITAGASTFSGNVTAPQFVGNASTVTNGVYTTSNINIGTTSIAVGRSPAAQTLTGVSVDGNAGTVGGLAVHAGNNTEPNKIVRTDGSGYLYTNYINCQAAYNSAYTTTSPVYIWGSNGSNDSFLRAYTPNYLAVGLLGTWTPVLSVTGQTPTSIVASGRSIKIGKMVYVWFGISATFTATAITAMAISGLPFAPQNEHLANLSTFNLNTTVFPTARVTASSTISFVTNPSATTLAITPTAGGKNITGYACYETSAAA